MRDKSRERPGPSENQATVLAALFASQHNLSAPYDQTDKGPIDPDGLDVLQETDYFF